LIQLVIITGISGAGKASAAKVFEDLAYTVVDNLPPPLLPDLVQHALSIGEESGNPRLAVVIDSRSGVDIAQFGSALKIVESLGIEPVVLYFDASESALVQRFKETRRRHPLHEENDSILSSLHAERLLMDPLRARADKVIDTSELSLPGLRELISADFAQDREKNKGLAITISSFGFKYGLPLDADLVFDVRFLTNPHYVDDLRPLDGRDPRVQEFIRSDSALAPYLEKVEDLIAFSLPRYIAEGKAYLTISFGCTGGRHRSVMVSEQVAEYLRARGYHLYVQHRDVQK
jgi:UPF0042 nucleotide-binding protein